MTKFSCSLDITSKIVTGSIVLFAVGMVMFSVGGITGERTMTILLITAAFLLVLVAAMFLLMPAYLTASDEGITIARLFRPVTIPYSNIRTVKLMSEQEMGSVIRTFGNGGIFGYVGKFNGSKVGPMTWYCTRQSGFVVIETSDNRKLIITPDDPQALIDAVRKVRPGIVLPSVYIF